MMTPRKMTMLHVASILVCCCVLAVQCRPQQAQNEEVGSAETAPRAIADLGQDVSLTKETKIGESTVYGLISNDSEDKDAKQETEDFDSKFLSFFDNIQQKFVNLLNPGAVVDKATPKDYEANPIEDYEAFRTGIVGTVDFLAKQLNDAIAAPKNVLKKANKSLVKSLNDIGAKLSGLE